jgi:hypothetical protein
MSLNTINQYVIKAILLQNLNVNSSKTIDLIIWDTCNIIYRIKTEGSFIEIFRN